MSSSNAASFGKGVLLLISVSPYVEAEQFSRLTGYLMISNHSLDLGGSGEVIACPLGTH